MVEVGATVPTAGGALFGAADADGVMTPGATVDGGEEGALAPAAGVAVSVG